MDNPGFQCSMPAYLAIGKPVVDTETGEMTPPPELVVSASLLKIAWSKSPYHVWSKAMKEGVDDDTSRKRLGSLVHSVLLEPEMVPEEYVVLPKPDPNVFTLDDGSPSKNPRATKAYKQAVGALLERDVADKGPFVLPEPDPSVFTRLDGTPSLSPKNTMKWRQMREERYEQWRQAKAPPKTPVEYDQMLAAMACRGMTRECEEAALILDMDGQVERTFLHREEVTGLMVKIRPDKLIHELGWDVNIKGCRSAKEEHFKRDCYNFRHFIGVGLYKLVLEQCGFEWRRSVLLATELDPPHVAKPWEADEGMLDAGERAARTLLNEIARCRDKGKWPAYGDEIDRITLPHDAWEKIDERCPLEHDEYRRPEDGV